jgi:hypothetical protein
MQHCKMQVVAYRGGGNVDEVFDVVIVDEPSPSESSLTLSPLGTFSGRCCFESEANLRRSIT